MVAVIAPGPRSRRKTRRRVSPLLLALIPLIFAGVSRAQSDGATVTKDSQALAILGRYLQAAGGTQALTAIQDYSASGTVTFNWADTPVRGTVSVKGRGVAQFRMDSTTPDGNESLIVDHRSGVLVTIDGKFHPQAPYNILNAGDLTFPAPRIAVDANDSAVSVTYVGESVVHGRTAYHVRLTPPLTGGLKWISGLGDAGALDLHIDASNFELLEEEETLHGRSDRRQTLLEQIDFANYQAMNGVLAPLTVSAKLSGQPLWSISLTSISFNNGFTDSDFATGLPKPGRAQ